MLSFGDQINNSQMKKLLYVSLFVLIGPAAVAQVGLAFVSGGREVAVSTNFEKRVWGEFRLSTKPYGDLFEDLDGNLVKGIPQILCHTNLVRNSQVALSLGLGLGYSPWSAFTEGYAHVTLPVAIRTAPFAKARNFYLLGEFGPKILPGSETGYVYPSVSWGMRYLFLKQE